MLLNAIEAFSNWSGMEVKIVKSCGMWFGLRKQDERLPLSLLSGVSR
jgi:hypothetical protein